MIRIISSKLVILFKAFSTPEPRRLFMPLRRAASILASPVAIMPKIELAQASPHFGPAYGVAATPLCVLVYQNPVSGDLAVAHAVSNVKEATIKIPNPNFAIRTIKQSPFFFGSVVTRLVVK